MAKGEIENNEEEEKTFSSEVAEHLIKNKHDKKDMEIEFLGFETKWWERGVKESIYIRKEKPTLNVDKGRYNLSRIWDNVIIKDEIIKRRQYNDVEVDSNDVAMAPPHS